MICAAPGHVLIGADFSCIESRVLAWVAGEEWKLDSYRRFDATRDPRDEPYCITACRIFVQPIGTYTKDHPSAASARSAISPLVYGRSRSLAEIRAGRFTDDEVRAFKREWRAAHPTSRSFGHASIVLPGQRYVERGRVVRCGPVAFKSTGAFLQLKLRAAASSLIRSHV